MSCVITEEKLSELEERIRPYLKQKRYAHTLAVAREAERLGRAFLPEKVMKLRAAALLHDITKKDDLEKQLQYCREFGIIYCNADLLSPKTFHARTAAGVAARDFSDVTDPEILSGIRWHTTGHDGMTDFEAIIYLADYIEETRTFPDCVALREFFYDGKERDACGMLRHFTETMIRSFDLTVENLISEGMQIDADTIAARNYYIRKLRCPDGPCGR